MRPGRPCGLRGHPLSGPGAMRPRTGRGTWTLPRPRQYGRIRPGLVRVPANSRPVAAVSSRPVLTSPVTSPPSTKGCGPCPPQHSRPLTTSFTRRRRRNSICGWQTVSRTPPTASRSLQYQRFRVSEGGLELTRDPSVWTHPARFCGVLSTNRRVAVSSRPVPCGPVTSLPLANGLQFSRSSTDRGTIPDEERLWTRVCRLTGHDRVSATHGSRSHVLPRCPHAGAT